MSGRPPVPDPVGRRLRQEAGFGCCKCGYPLYDYHHIISYAADNHFRPEDMMVLCPNHHREATNGVLDESEQRHFKANPYNIAHGAARGPLAVNQRVLAISLGSVQFVGDGTFIRIDNQPLLGLATSMDGRLLLSVELYDRDDNLLCCIEKNEWIAGGPFPWDLEYGGRWLSIRSRQRDISLHVDARSNIVSVRGQLWFKQQCFDIKEHMIELNGATMQAASSGIHHSGVSDLCFIGAGLEATTEPPMLAIVPDPRFGKSYIVSWPDVDGQVQKGIEAWATLIGKSASAAGKVTPHRPTSQMPLSRRNRKK